MFDFFFFFVESNSTPTSSLCSREGSHSSSTNSFSSEVFSETDSTCISELSEETPFSQKLYEGAPITAFESHMLCFQFAVRHSLTNVAFTELLQLVGAHLPQCNVPTSVYRLKKFFLDLFPHAKCCTHDYCTDCHRLLKPNQLCQTAGCGSLNSDQFISIPLESQLKQLIKGEV